MKHYNKLIELFNNSVQELNITYSNNFRKVSEQDYFKAYLIFLNNSIHYKRFDTYINNCKISGKYLNEKVNTWRKLGIIDNMYKNIIAKYKKINTSKNCYIDGRHGLLASLT